MDARRNVDERTTRPHRGVEGGELVVVRRDQRAEVFLDEVGVVAEGGVHVGEQHTDVVQVLLDLVVDDLALVLCRHTAEVLLLGLGDPQLVPGPADVLGQVLPILGLLLRGTDEVVDVVEVDAGQVRPPPRHGALFEMLQGLQPALAHPVRLGLARGDLLDDRFGQPALGLEDGVRLVLPVEPIPLAQLSEVFLLANGHAVIPLHIDRTDARRSRSKVYSRGRIRDPGHIVLVTGLPWCVTRPPARHVRSASWITLGLVASPTCSSASRTP